MNVSRREKSKNVLRIAVDVKKAASNANSGDNKSNKELEDVSDKLEQELSAMFFKQAGYEKD
jgi:hypothetical protein